MSWRMICLVTVILTNGQSSVPKAYTDQHPGQRSLPPTTAAGRPSVQITSQKPPPLRQCTAMSSGLTSPPFRHSRASISRMALQT